MRPIPLLMSLSTLLLFACDRTELTGPPEVRVGRDECIECGMLIAEPEYACAFLVEERGWRRHLIFDDIGCMIDVEGKLDESSEIVAGFVPDHGDGSWIDARAAHYILADPDALRTPMGTGIVAYRSRTDADAAATRLGGEVMDVQRLRAARREWLAERRRRHEPSP